ncbi:permease [Paenibacillus sp. NEAU-GSW1]|uniref:permease n=1 Tax=Paenibacillus sp. NEAU-GSW1 TaxID=2682486 RepID=UPI0012E12A69|nr:permease [Paenibacillus sp. NEAU-GSW1]MUT65212.1 permease [Paenibacillus sp. NEAU-GSW1]
MKTILQLNTIFLSMIMEAIPFVLLGVLISGFIQIFVTEKWIARMMPKNRVLASLFGCGIGILFPSCECGIVPITRRLLKKGVPLNAGIAFMLTGPIINPIVLFSTYIAFGNDWQMVGIRAGMAIAVALAVSIIVGILFPVLPFRQTAVGQQAAAAAESAPSLAYAEKPRVPLKHQMMDVLHHAVEEFFSVGKYLVLGAFIASCMQTFIPTSTLLHYGSNPLTASLIMIALAFTMSLCSEADAFIAASFRSTFSVGSLSAFLVFGPMIDIKNTLMLLGTFRGKFVATLIALVTVFTLLGSLLVGRLFG